MPRTKAAKSLWRDDIPQIRNPVRFLLFVSKPHAVPALLGFLAVITASVLNAFVPYLYKVIADTAVALDAGSFDALWKAVGIYIIVSIVGMLLWRTSGFLGMAWATGVRATARSALSAHLTLHAHQYFSNRFAGSLLSKVKQAADGAQEMSQTFLWQFARVAVSLVASFAIVFFTSPLVGCILVALFIVITPLNILFARGACRTP